MSYKTVQVPKCHGPRVLKGYTLNGYEVIILENELLRVMINVERGGTIQEFLYKPCDLDVMYKNPRGVRHHSEFTISSYDVIPFSDHHPDGWFECFPSGSSPVTQAGARVGFHGEIWGLPFELLAIEEKSAQCSATMTGMTLRTPWKLTKKFQLKKNDPTLYLEETATNLSNENLSVMWGQHPTYGAPFLDDQCFIEVATKTFLPDWKKEQKEIWPNGSDGRDLSKVAAKHSGLSKMIFLTDLAQGQYRIVSPTWKVAFELRWDRKQFPWCWLCERCSAGGWGDYFLAMEPFTGLPLAIETGKGVMPIAAGKSKTVRFEAAMLKI
ncbi:MAG: DUF4432 family protein [Planctomycetota bacterium]